MIENEERKMIDQAVIDRINQGDVKAFECLYNDYFVYLCACANSYIFNAEEAQDIVNEVFMKLWYKRGDLFYSSLSGAQCAKRMFELFAFTS